MKKEGWTRFFEDHDMNLIFKIIIGWGGGNISFIKEVLLESKTLDLFLALLRRLRKPLSKHCRDQERAK